MPEDFPRISETHIESQEIKIWEGKIKYYQSYIYDKQLLPGMIYEVKDGNLVPKVLEEATENLNKISSLFTECSEEEREFAEMWAKLLEYPAPKFRQGSHRHRSPLAPVNEDA